VIAAIGAAEQPDQDRKQDQGHDHRLVLDDQPADGDVPVRRAERISRAFANPP
jgi:hypothetical protein